VLETRTLSFSLLGLALCAIAAGCATTRAAVPELADARRALEHATHGPAPALAPRELEVARTALAHAEAASSQGALRSEQETLAYVALRRAELADAVAGASQAERKRLAAQIELLGAVAELRARMAAQEEQVNAARKAQEESTARAQQALLGLGTFAQVERDARRIVVRVPEASLFDGGRSKLVEAAHPRLDHVAAALREQPERRIVIQAHSNGDGPRGDALARRRADAVRDYLVSRGLPKARMHVVIIAATLRVLGGRVGRPEPRRVDIVLEPADAAVQGH
jgi:outer membrane protein OmpA-like peptidoglycan-associated protein